MNVRSVPLDHVTKMHTSLAKLCQEEGHLKHIQLYWLRDYGISQTNITEQPSLLTALIDVAALEAIALPVTTITLYLVLVLFVDGPRRLFIAAFLLHTVIEKAATLTWEKSSKNIPTQILLYHFFSSLKWHTAIYIKSRVLLLS
jgi:hypothetical protein